MSAANPNIETEVYKPKEISPRKRHYKEMAGRFFQNKLAVVGGFFTLLLILTALFAPVIAPQDPTAQDYSKYLQGPSSSNWFGTDDLGRDILSRIIYRGTGVLAGWINISRNCVSSRYSGRAVFWLLPRCAGSVVVMRISDAPILAFPPLVLALALAAVLGDGISENAMIAIGLFYSKLYSIDACGSVEPA